MQIDLAGKTALVTGGNIGIGRAGSLALARCGADVALTYFSHQTEGEETAKAIREMGRKAFAFQLDATNSEQVDQVVGQAAEALGGHIDILMNNASVHPQSALFKRPTSYFHKERIKWHDLAGLKYLTP